MTALLVWIMSPCSICIFPLWICSLCTSCSLLDSFYVNIEYKRGHCNSSNASFCRDKERRSCCNDKSEDLKKRRKGWKLHTALTAWLIKRYTDQRGSIKIGPGSSPFFSVQPETLEEAHLSLTSVYVQHDGCLNDVWESTYLSGHTWLCSELPLFFPASFLMTLKALSAGVHWNLRELQSWRYTKQPSRDI